MARIAMRGAPNAATAAVPWTARLSAPTLAIAVSGALCAIYLAWSPIAPDLAAQLARADLVRRAGDVSWWTGWFGGLSLPTYSVVSPPLMATIGVRMAGALMTLASCWGAALLMRHTLRPRAGAVTFSLFSVADLLVGRVTFAIGLGFAVWSLVALRARLRSASVLLAPIAYLSSPLAGLFLGLALLAVAFTDRSRRLPAALGAGVLLIAAVVMAALFPGTGLMHFSAVSAIAPGVACAVVALTCRPRIVRAAALLTLATFPIFMIAPGAVGSNIERLAWVCAVPVLVACGSLDRRRLAAASIALAVWPVITTAAQVRWMTDPTTQASYYTPVLQALRHARTSAGPEAVGARVELLDTVNHSGTSFLAPQFALARGWDRQADEAGNPIFYRSGALSPASYHAWLRDLAVAWVAVPATRLDYASRAEARLIETGLPYLKLIWSTPQWQLFRVRDPAPLATGATVTAVGPSSITLRATARTTVQLRVRWTPYLRAVDATDRSAGACVVRDGDWTTVELPAAGRYSVVSSFNPLARFDPPSDDCS